MTARFTQVSRGRWPHGIDKPIAVLRAEPAELARRFNVRFIHGMDELDEFEQAGLKLKAGRPVLLTRYRRSPGPGTTISVDCGDDATEALRDVRRALELSPRELAWVADDVEEEPRRSMFAACAESVRSWIAGRVARKATAIQGAVNRPLQSFAWSLLFRTRATFRAGVVIQLNAPVCTMPIKPAHLSDLAAVVRLLREADLPHADLTPGHLAHFLVLREGDAIVGVVGMEVADDAGLLRSLAVADARRGAGVASRLVDVLEAHARAAGIRALYLLTTTAEGFFARRGYASTDRGAVPDAILATEEFRSICPSTAACMSKPLVDGEERTVA